MSATRKKVVVRLLGGELYRGYLPASDFGAEAALELLLPDGRASVLPRADVKHIAFVKDFNLNDTDDPERMGVRSFASKPRSGGVWIRLRFTDDDSLEGLMQGGLAFLDSLLLEHGVFLDPPDKRGNTQRVFVPRSALSDFTILGWAGNPGPPRRLATPGPQRQGDLFGGPAGD